MIPEVLVKEHEDVYALFSEKHATVTLNHIGAALEWASEQGYNKSKLADIWYGSHRDDVAISTSELLTKYFESIKNK